MVKYGINADPRDMSVIFSRICSEDGIFYKQIDAQTAAEKFTGEDRFSVFAADAGMTVGFASGAIDRSRRTGYISYAGVLPEYRNRGIGSELIGMLEKLMSDTGLIDKIETVFYNPVHLEWFIPNGNGDDHPCAPGTDKSSEMYKLLIKRGYFEWTMQNSYYLRLDGYTDPPALADSRARLLSEGIEITLYDPEKHKDLEGLFDNIANPGWKAQVMAHTDRPIVVAVDHNNGDLVVSYTGPLSTDRSGRGNFCGIGTRREYRGRGIGKCVFCEMCRRHSERGATFMSLYTGDTNPARNIYESAGFAIVRSWGNLRKIIEK